MKNLVRRILRLLGRTYSSIISLLPNPKSRDKEFLLQSITSHGIPAALDFKYNLLCSQVTTFTSNMEISLFKYRYSKSTCAATLYSTVYACLIKSITGEIGELSENEKDQWAEYLNQFQSEKDGLFRDPVISSPIFEETDWWGARHLLLHIMPAYISIKRIPKYPFSFLDSYKSTEFLTDWIDSQDWDAEFTPENDFDNKIMNIACALQFERDFRGDIAAGNAITFIKYRLEKYINPETGMWGQIRIDNPKSLSRSVQFAYHLLSIFFYDKSPIKYPEKIIDLTLKTQNIYGGYGAAYNSSACEDIDSIDILVRLSKITSWRKNDIDISLKRAMIWTLSNQNKDGGFVFRRNEDFTYGHLTMKSQKNESAMFPTWFRFLAITLISLHFKKSSQRFPACPGLQF